MEKEDEKYFLDKVDKIEKSAAAEKGLLTKRAKRYKYQKITAKAALEKAFYDIGGVDGLAKWGREYRTEFYKLWSKIIPLSVDAKMSMERLIIAETPSPKTIDHQPGVPQLDLSSLTQPLEPLIINETQDKNEDCDNGNNDLSIDKEGSSG